MAAEIRFLTDENFTQAIVDGVLRRVPNLDIVRVQDVGLRTLRDPVMLEFAASDDRIVLTHDIATMGNYARDRLAAGKPMPGVFEISQNLPIGRVIDEIVMIAECSRDDEWNGSIRRLPL